MKHKVIKVLIVDDSLIILARLVDELSTVEGVEVVGLARDIREAKESFEELRPDAVILDIRMPGGSGIDVLRHIKEQSPQTIVIMLTNFAEEQYRKSCEKAGADYFLDKSNEFNTISNLLTNLNAASRG